MLCFVFLASSFYSLFILTRCLALNLLQDRPDLSFVINISYLIHTINVYSNFVDQLIYSVWHSTSSGSWTICICHLTADPQTNTKTPPLSLCMLSFHLHSCVYYYSLVALLLQPQSKLGPHQIECCGWNGNKIGNSFFNCSTYLSSFFYLV